MEIMRLLSVAVLLMVSAVFAQKATFHNYQVHKLVPEFEEQLEFLKNLQNSNTLNFWIDPSGINSTVLVMVPPHFLPQFTDMMGHINMKSELYINNVQELVDNERPKVRPRADFGWEDYYTLDEIYSWLDSLVEAHPGVVSTIIGGKSYEGRQIKGVKVSKKEGNPGVIIEGNIHAREWITSATVTYILNKLLTSKDPAIQELTNSFDFYVFPNVNPDGFEYSHTKDRMWRKTRSPVSNGCYGADPNRNWDFHWMAIGASSQPCSETYGGPKAESEIETSTFADYLRSINNKFDVYLAFHSFSQLLMFPYGHTPQHVSNYDELMNIAVKAAAALAKNNGTQYDVGDIYETIYPTSGVSMDWVKGVLNKRFTFTWELRDTGRYGFLLPASQIIDTAEETLNSVVVILQSARSALSVV